MNGAEDAGGVEAGGVLPREVGFAERVGLVPPKDGEDPYAHRRGEPRGFALLWTVYLVGVSLVSFASLGEPWKVTQTGYAWAARTVVVLVMVGVCLLWPMFRLSQVLPRASGVRAVLHDVPVMWIPVQAIVWPQTLVAGWPVLSALSVSLHVLAWVVLVGGVLALAMDRGERSAPRGLDGLQASSAGSGGGARGAGWWLVGLAGISVIPPVVWALVGPGPHDPDGSVWRFFVRLSPLAGADDLLSDASLRTLDPGPTAAQWRSLAAVGVAGVLAWVIALAFSGARAGAGEDSGEGAEGSQAGAGRSA